MEQARACSRGPCTGAHADTQGKGAAADGGTLFLEEIGELPLEIQAKLLRLLQEREYERAGETKPRRVNVRVISATNRDLAQAVAAGKFREDLFYRLNVIPPAPAGWFFCPPPCAWQERISSLLISNVCHSFAGLK